MSEKIIFATGNAGKLKEIREILKDLNREIVTMREAGFEGEIEENGTTFRENAEIKAKTVWEKTGGIVLADDSGLVIDYLNGEPGVYSARYLGDTAYEEKNRILIERVKDAKGKERSARFMCNIAAVLPDGRVLHTEAGSFNSKYDGSDQRGAAKTWLCQGDDAPLLSAFFPECDAGDAGDGYPGAGEEDTA